MGIEQKIRVMMVGGGEGAFIGNVHRMAMRLDGHYDLVAGAFSSQPAVSERTGGALGLSPDRVSGDWAELLAREAALPADRRTEAVVIVTPNHLHLPIAVAALEQGFHVISDKPAALDLAEALTLQKAVTNSDRVYALTHTYLGYPLVKEARERVARGDFGRIRKVFVSYPQGWLSEALEQTGAKQAAWRTDPQRSGPSGCLGDIGTHAATLAEYVVGHPIAEVCADVQTVVPGRRLDDDGAALLRFEGGATGCLMASQVCNGEENALTISVYGEDGGLEWHQMQPNALMYRRQGQPAQVLRTGTDQTALSDRARLHCRLPAGHPEGYVEAFANIYTAAAHAIRKTEDRTLRDFPSIACGVAGHRFVDAALRSSAAHGQWTPTRP